MDQLEFGPAFFSRSYSPEPLGHQLAATTATTFQTGVISADARQFYYDMPIGTAQPTPAEKKGIGKKGPHHFLAFLAIQESYTAGKFGQAALQSLAKLFIDHDVVIVTGGSGLYIQALCE